jgi:hypothetical protein
MPGKAMVAAVARRGVGVHRAQAVLEPERRAQHVDLEHAQEVLPAQVHDQARDLDPRVVDEDVEAAEPLDGGGDRRLPARLVGDVERDGLPVDLRGDLRGVLDVADHHPRTGCGECPRHTGTEPLRAARDERATALEHSFSHLLSSVRWTVTDPTARS